MEPCTPCSCQWAQLRRTLRPVTTRASSRQQKTRLFRGGLAVSSGLYRAVFVSYQNHAKSAERHARVMPTAGQIPINRAEQAAKANTKPQDARHAAVNRMVERMVFIGIRKRSLRGESRQPLNCPGSPHCISPRTQWSHGIGGQETLGKASNRSRCRV